MIDDLLFRLDTLCPTSTVAFVWKKYLVILHNFDLSNPLHIKTDKITYLC